MNSGKTDKGMEFEVGNAGQQDLQQSNQHPSDRSDPVSIDYNQSMRIHPENTTQMSNRTGYKKNQYGREANRTELTYQTITDDKSWNFLTIRLA